MPDQVPGGAPATGQPAPVVHPTADTLDLSKFFGPAVDASVSGPPATTPPVEAAPAETPAPEVKPEPEKAPEPIKEVESEIAKALREMREERASQAKEKAEVASWKGKYEAVVEEMEQLRSAPAFEDDPIRYARSRKWTPEQQAEVVKMLAYDLAPDQAPQDFRFKIFEKKQALKAEQERAEREAQMAQQAQAEQVQQLQTFIRGLEAAASTFTDAQFPSNDAWYGDNRKAYVTDLYHTANELAEEAAAKGERADLSAATLAARLEQRNAEKLAAIEARRSKRKAPAAPEQKPADVTPNVDVSPASTHGLNQGGPRPPAMTDEERVRRATLAAFGGR